jgi:hypothetical protein
MSESDDRTPSTDDGLPWGFIDVETGEWVRLPKGPGLVDMGPPPFDVTLFDGRVRRVVHEPPP